MNTPVEERLRRALAQQAEATTVAPDGWRRIQARLGPDRRWRPSGFRQWLLLAPAAGVAVVALVIVAVLAGRDGAKHGPGDGRPRPALPGAHGRGTPLPAPECRSGSPGGPAAARDLPGLRPAGRRRCGPGGVARHHRAGRLRPARSASSETAICGCSIRTCQWPKTAQGRRSCPGPRRTAGRRWRSWRSACPTPQLVAVVQSLLPGDATTATPALPPGFVTVRSRALPERTGPMSVQYWGADDGAGFGVSVSDTPNATVDDLAWWLPGGKATKVRGKTAIYTDRSGGLLTWMERPGVAVTVYGGGLTERELVAIAEGLRPIDETAWQALVDRVGKSGRPGRARPLPAPPPAVTPSLDVYSVPVTRQTAPPCCIGDDCRSCCPRRKDGREVACYQVGHSARALVRRRRHRRSPRRSERPARGRWSTPLTARGRGPSRRDAAQRAASAGRSPSLLTAWSFRPSGWRPRRRTARASITGLDEKTARHLADRLPR